MEVRFWCPRRHLENFACISRPACARLKVSSSRAVGRFREVVAGKRSTARGNVMGFHFISEYSRADNVVPSRSIHVLR